MLPGANCGACGFPGCRGFAEQAVAGKVKPAQMQRDRRRRRGVDRQLPRRRRGRSEQARRATAVRRRSNVAVQQAEYRGLTTCGAAAAVAGGGKGCAWGCLGFGDCAVSCTFGAITMNDSVCRSSTSPQCTACGDCVDACPKNLFEIIPLDQQLLVQCRSMIEGDGALASVRRGVHGVRQMRHRCRAGTRSASSAASARVHYEQNAQADRSAAIARCPTGAIVWLDGAQFAATAARDAVTELTGSARVMKLWIEDADARGSSRRDFPVFASALDGSSAVVAMETAASEAAGAYPITPSTQMGEGWAAAVAEGQAQRQRPPPALLRAGRRARRRRGDGRNEHDRAFAPRTSRAGRASRTCTSRSTRRSASGSRTC